MSIVHMCQECVDGSWGVHRCTALEECECKSDECLPPVWVGSPRWVIGAESRPVRKVALARGPKSRRQMCSCDGPPHTWSPGWCSADGPVTGSRER